VADALSLDPRFFIKYAVESHSSTDIVLGYMAPSDKYNILRYYQHYQAGSDYAYFKFMSPYVERAVLSGMIRKDPEAYLATMLQLSTERHEE
jgi:hypothetical protein